MRRPAFADRVAAGLAAVLLLAACGSSAGSSTATIPAALRAEARPIGVGPRFESKATGPVLGLCRRRLGPRFGVHVEVFAENRVVLIPAGIGARPPRQVSFGRISAARCWGALVTVEPTGVVLVARGARLTVADLFRSWGQPLRPDRLAGFPAPPGSHVTAYVDGRRWRAAAGAVPLRDHAEIVLEVGPHVPPHRAFTFPPGT